MEQLRVVVLVSPDPSDIYFANRLARRLQVVGIFVERQQEAGDLLSRLNKWGGRLARPWQLPRQLRERKIFQDHYARTGRIDWELLGEDGFRLDVPTGCTIVHTEGSRAICRVEYVDRIRAMRPHVIAVCGASILKGEILSVAPYGILNLHGGLSQRYRGIWTTLWAVVRTEPEYIGATVHFVSPGIDDGDIVYQGRPEVSPDDNPETLYIKVVKLGIEMMCRAVEDMGDQALERFPLIRKGDLYLGSMVTPDVIRQAWDNIEQGIIPSYLEHREACDRPVLALMRGNFHLARAAQT